MCRHKQDASIKVGLKEAVCESADQCQVNLTFVGTCIVIYFYSKTNQIHNISNLFYFGTTLYMFRTLSPSIIGSLRLYVQHKVYVIQVLWLLASGNEMERSSISFPLRLLMMDGQTVRSMSSVKLDVCLSVHRCICVQKKNHLDVTEWFIALMKC